MSKIDCDAIRLDLCDSLDLSSDYLAQMSVLLDCLAEGHEPPAMQALLGVARIVTEHYQEILTDYRLRAEKLRPTPPF